MRLLPLISGLLRLVVWIKVQRCENVPDQAAEISSLSPSYSSPSPSSSHIFTSPNGVPTKLRTSGGYITRSTTSNQISPTIQNSSSPLRNITETRVEETASEASLFTTTEWGTETPSSKEPMLKCKFEICLVLIILVVLVVGTGITALVHCRRRSRHHKIQHTITPGSELNSGYKSGSCALTLMDDTNVYTDAIDLEIEGIARRVASMDTSVRPVKPAKPAKPVRINHNYVNISIQTC